jgi:hypothetical protein
VNLGLSKSQLYFYQIVFGNTPEFAGGDAPVESGSELG